MSESLKINGAIKVINDTETFKGNFTKKTFVITTAGKYPQPVMFETIKDQTSLLDVLKDFGWVMCGWSGEYDKALHNAFLNCKCRYAMYRTQLIGSSGGQNVSPLDEIKSIKTIEIENADNFFVDLENHM